MKIVLSFILLMILVQSKDTRDQRFFSYNTFEVKQNGRQRKISCPIGFSCYLYLSSDSLKFGNESYAEFLLPEDGNYEENQLKTYFRIESNRFYYFSDYYDKLGLGEALLFAINSDTTSSWTVERFYAAGLASFKIKQVSFKYDQHLNDTLHTYEISNYRFGISHYPTELSKITFSKKYLFQELEYKVLKFWKGDNPNSRIRLVMRDY